MDTEIYKGYEITKIESGYRVTKLKSDDIHTHLSNKLACYNAVDYVLSGKIPKRTGNYYLTSLTRLSIDQNYINKINELIKVRKSKGRKQYYFNPSRKK